MTLLLDHLQRINLHALFGSQRGPTLDDTRAFWKLQDRVELSADEQKAIGYHIVTADNGLSGPQWDPQKSLPHRPFDFSDAEIQRIQKTLKEWQPGFLAHMDRKWLEPLLEQLEGTGKLQLMETARAN